MAYWWSVYRQNREVVGLIPGQVIQKTGTSWYSFGVFIGVKCKIHILWDVTISGTLTSKYAILGRPVMT